MTIKKYVLLRDHGRTMVQPRLAGGRHALHRGASATAAPSSPAIEVADLSTKDLHDVARDPSISVAAPQVPMRLVEPMSRHAPDSASTAETSWGVDAVGALTTPFDGAGIKVAVLDTGIDDSHVAFTGVQLEQHDYTGDGNGDVDGHGTHCAGTIFGRNVGGKRIGVAPGITHAFIGKVLGSQGGGSDAIARAILDAANAGCSVISMSLGIDFPGFQARLAQNLPETLATGIALDGYRANVRLFDAIGEQIEAQAQFAGREILLIAASGNESRRAEHPNFELPATPPSEAEGFVSVGAVERAGGDLVVADFSNTGCSLCAPGVGISSARHGSTDQLVAFSGTSMAAPHVAGVAALWVQKILEEVPASPGFFGRALEARSRLIGTARRQSFAPGVDLFDVGAGLVQAPQPD